MQNFYKGKKILITGHTGFKGSWLTQTLLNFEAEVFGYALPPESNPNLFEILQLEKKIHNKFADIRDFDQFNNFVKETNPEIIIHLAAQPIVLTSYQDPRYTYETNLMGTVNVLEAIRLNEIPTGLIITTDKVYKNENLDNPFKEDDELNGKDPYSNSKSCAELAFSSYLNSFFNPKDYNKNHNSLLASARSGNIIGGGDWSEYRLIPDIIRAIFEKNEEIEIRNPKATRPWFYILDCINAYLKLIEKLHKKEVTKVGSWNFSPNLEDKMTVEELSINSLEILQKGQFKIKESENNKEAKFLQLDNRKAKEELNWEPKNSVKESIKKTMNWYQEFYQGNSSIIDYTVEEINSYFN